MKLFIQSITFLLFLGVFSPAKAQDNIQGTVEKVGTIASVSAQAAAFPLVNAEITNMNILVSIEDIYGPVTAAVHTNYISNLMWTPSAPQIIGGRRYFLFIGLDNGTALLNWPLNTPQKIIDIEFSGGNISPYEAPVRLSDLNTGMDNNIWFVEVNGADQTHYTTRFFSTPNTTAVTNGPTEWSVETLGLVPLPVELLGVHAKWDNNHEALVQWSTATEKDLDHFTIERSNNEDAAFTKVGEIKAVGNSSGVKPYSFTDKSVSGERSDLFYYRLKLVDRNGRFAYSPVVSLEREQAFSFMVSPNPNNGLFSLTITSDFDDLVDPSYVITDVAGRMIKNGAITSANMPFDMSKSEKGIYFLSVLSAEKEIKLYKIVKGEDK